VIPASLAGLIDPMPPPPFASERRVVLLLMVVFVVLSPVVIGMFLLAMERLEFRLLDTVPTAEFDHALLAPRTPAGERPMRVRAGRKRAAADPGLAAALGALAGEVAGPTAEPKMATKTTH
jgi:hypothetical protein